MKKTLLLVLAALLLCACDPHEEKNFPAWELGYAERELPLDDLADKTYYMAGYHNDHPATGILDLQKVRAVYMAAGKEELLLIAADCIGLSSGDVQKIKDSLPGPLKRIAHVASTHTHAGVDTLGLWGPLGENGKDPDFLSELYKKAAEAATEAYENRRAGRLYYGSTSKGIENLQEDSRAPYVYDKAIRRIRFEPSSGGAGIQIINYAAHAESLRGDNTLVSADFPRYLCDAIKRETGDDALFFPAAIGGLIMTRRLTDGNGRAYPVDVNVVMTGERLASAALSVEDETELSPELRFFTRSFTIPLDNGVFAAMRALGVLTNKVKTSGEGRYGLSVETSVSLIDMGGLSVVCVPGELFPELAYGKGKDTGVTKSVREIFGDDFLVFGLFDDEIGYIVPPSDFLVHETDPYISKVKDGTGEDHYEETNSVGPEAAERILSALEALADLKNAE